MIKNKGLAFKMITACLVAAAMTIAFLSYVGRSARLRVASQYTSPDYVRYISQGYAFDTVSTKKNILLTVTDGELPIRVHIFTIDRDKKTLDILELPPDTFVVADGFSGTLREAFMTPVYKEIISRVLCLKIDGSATFCAKTLGDGAQMLGVIDSQTGEAIAIDGFAYSSGNVKSVEAYRKLAALILNELCERGSLDSFALLMNLIVNRVSTDMTIEDIIDIVNCAKGIKPKKMNIRLAIGNPAKCKDDIVWVLHAEAVAELLNEHFRVRGIEYPAESLSIPQLAEGDFPYKDLPERVTDIKK